jgi:hypothetical protein
LSRSTQVEKRWLLESGDTVPYWITLGLAGISLLGFGVTLLVAHDWWDGMKQRAARWWQLDDENGAGALG